jgi:hypothetical protein
MKDAANGLVRKQKRRLVLSGACCALSPDRNVIASIEIESGKIVRIGNGAANRDVWLDTSVTIDLDGYLLLPGLVNAHDHLEFALYPRLAGGIYGNYVEWGEDIHDRFANVICAQHGVPKSIRLLWGGVRNLLCGVTTVCHHNPLYPALLQDDFPVRVVKHYGWAHSLALGEDLLAAHGAAPESGAFVIHAGEGVDDRARNELLLLDRLGVLDERTVIVHGLALGQNQVELMNRRGSALVVCPSSNEFLFGRVPDWTLVSRIRRVALGSDSPLTAVGDLLDEARFAIDRCGHSSSDVYSMVTVSAAEILRLKEGEGTIAESGVGDIIAVADTGVSATEQLRSLGREDIELVVIGGRVQLASAAMLERLPPSCAEGLEALSFGGTKRWVRAPIAEMLDRAELALGKGNIRLGGRPVSAERVTEASNVA